MFSTKRKKPLRNLLSRSLAGFLFFFFCSPAAFATDEGDFLVHAVEAWNPDLKAFQTRADVAYAFWNDFSVGPVFEVNRYFYTPAIGVTWHLEPFEILADAGPLFWRKGDEKKTAVQFSVHANYLVQVTTHFQPLLTAGINLPDKYFRGVPLGAGFRYWF